MRPPVFNIVSDRRGMLSHFLNHYAHAAFPTPLSPTSNPQPDNLALAQRTD